MLEQLGLSAEIKATHPARYGWLSTGLIKVQQKAYRQPLYNNVY
jgi:hypothetical protein